MTKAEIIAELRRSAREDADPWCDMRISAFFAVMDWYGVICGCGDPEIERTFFLLVACALEDK